MRIFLLQDVKSVGRRFEIKEVSDGFGRNFLIARKLAEPVTSENEKRIKERQETLAKKTEQKEKDAEQVMAKLAGSTIKITARTNETGHLFAAISEEQIRQTLSLPEDIEIISSKPIKTTGEHTVEIKKGKLSAEIKILVEAAGG